MRKLFVNLPLRTKLTVFFTALLILSTWIFYMIVYGVTSEEYRSQIQHSADLSYSQAYDYTQNTLWPLLYTSEMLSLNGDVQSILSANARLPFTPRSLPQQYRDMLRLTNVIQSLESSAGEIEQLRLYVAGGPMYAGQDVFFSKLDDLKGLPEFNKPSVQSFWIGPEDLILAPNESPTRVVSLVRKIRDPDSYGEVIGAVRVCVRAEVLNDIIFRSNITSQGAVYIANGKGEIICSSGSGQFESLPDAVVSEWTQSRLGNETFLVKSLPVENTDWRMTALIPMSEIEAPGARIGSQMLATMLVIIFFAALCTFAFSGWFTGRMRRLVKNMVSVRRGTLDVEIGSEDKDEIGMLYDSFDYMVSELKNYARQQYENGKEIKNAELRTLQAQINPHFLYNTLDLINWEAMNHGVPEIAEVAQSLAQFYKLGLRKGQEIVTLRDELEHVGKYVKIQNHRFENSIRFQTEVPGDLLSLPILKILLQPLVENAILHGLAERADDRNRRLVIKALREQDLLVISISDNGKGMSAERLGNILTDDDDGADETHGYGVKNIQSRIRLYYGDEYGLHYTSQPGMGTVVEIHIPAL